MPISDQDLEGILRQAAALKYKGLDSNTAIALIRESVAGYNQQKPTATGINQAKPEAAEISLDSACETLCRLIESDRDLVKFGAYSWGNVTGHGDSKGAHGYGYDAQKREMVHGTLIGIPSTDPNNELRRWEKRLVHFGDQNKLMRGVDQAVQGEEYSKVLADTRGGLYYRVGIVITNDAGVYSNPEVKAINFVLRLFTKNPNQFAELMDKLADRYIPLYNQGIKALEADFRQKYGHRVSS